MNFSDQARKSKAEFKKHIKTVKEVKMICNMQMETIKKSS
jgi:hypothetical protein